VERGTLTVEAGGLFGLLLFLGVVPEVLLHEPLRVEMLNVEVLVLRPPPLLEVLGRGGGHGTQLAQYTAELLSGHAKLVWTEDEQREQKKEDELPSADAEHVLPRSSSTDRLVAG